MWPWTLLNSAFAAGLDADGVGLPVHDGSIGRPALLAAPPRLDAAGIALGLRTAVEVAPLVRSGPESPDPVAVIGSAGTTRLQGAVGIARQVSASVDLPVRLFAASDLDGAGGPALGDLRALVWGHADTGVARLGAGVGVRVPTGSKDRYSTAGRGIPMVRLTADTGETWRVSGLLGFDFEGTPNETRAVGGLVVNGGAALDRVAERWSAGVALRGETALNGDIQARRGSPLELGGHGTFGVNDNLTLDGLVTAGVLNAAGVPAFRASISGVYLLGKRAPEVVPDRMNEIAIVDPDGLPVAGAGATFANGETVVADAEGIVRWSGSDRPVVSAQGLESREAQRRGEVRLEWAPIDLRVRVATETGEAVEPVLTLDEGAPPLTLDEGVWTSSLKPGTWTLNIAAEEYGEQSREIIVAPGRFEPIDLEVVLLPVRGEARVDVEISDPQGRGILGTEVRIDGVAVGTAGQGTVGISGLESTTHEVAVDSQYFESETTEVDLTEGEGSAALSLYYAPGTVRVTAVGPNGPIRDGTVFFQGPRALPPLHLGDYGERLVNLANGTWNCTLSSPAYGLQERTLLVEPDGPVPLNAEFRLLPEAEGTADLIVQLTDPDGRSLEDVEILVDGLSVGRSGTGGELRLNSLQTGPLTVTTRGAALEDGRTTTVLRDGLQAVGIGLTWEQGAVRVAAHSPDGPADAFVEFDGPEAYPGDRLGDPGRKLFEDVPAGEWEIVASHEAGMEVAWTVVSDEGGRLTDVSIAIGEEDGDAGLELTVTDPDGEPVSGANVLLDGVRMAQTASGGRVRISGLTAGKRNLSVIHPVFETYAGSVNLKDGSNAEVATALQYRPGVLDLTVTLAGEPVSDAVVYISGPESVPAVEPGPDGSAKVALGVGDWSVLVSSPVGGLAERDITLAKGPPTPLTIDLDPVGGLVVRVVDVRGEPVPDVSIEVGGSEVGTTDRTGIGIVDLPEGGGTVSISHPHIEPALPSEVPADVKEQIFEVAWQRIDVPVRVRHDGDAVEARISANGPERIEPVAVSGSGAISLPPGRWEILASADELAVERKTVDVIAGVGQPAPVEFDLANARVRVTAEGIELRDVRFDLASDVALEQYAVVLEEVAATIVADPNIVSVEVQGHTDSQGGSEYNYDLSRRRAQSVVDALTALGVPPDLIVARGYGPSRPIADNETEEGRAKNRRVDFRTLVAEE